MIASQPDADGTPAPFLEDPVAVMDVIVANDGVTSIAFDADATIEEFVADSSGAARRHPGGPDDER